MRSRPRLSCSSGAHAPRGSVAVRPRRSRLVAAKASTKGSAQRVAWPGAVSSSTVRAQSSACLLERREDGAAVDRLVGEEVGGAHQHADAAPRAASGAAMARDHRRRPCVVDAAGEEDLDGASAVARCWQQASICASQRTKLVRGPTWPPHSRALEHEAAGAVLEEASSSPGDGTWR